MDEVERRDKMGRGCWNLNQAQLTSLHNCVHSIIGTVFTQQTQLLKPIYCWNIWLVTCADVRLIKQDQNQVDK